MSFYHICSIASLIASIVWLVTGCSTIDSRSIKNPGDNQFICVKSGDRLSFEVNEIQPCCRWNAKCDDTDVEVRIDRLPPPQGSSETGKAAVLIRIHRGFDGPSTVNFFSGKCTENKHASSKKFTISLYKRTGDAAFWK